MNDIKFIKGQGGLGRVLPNEDHISGLLFGISFTPPAIPPIIPFELDYVASLSDAEVKGITTDLYPREHTQISEFFALNPTAQLYVGFETAANGAFNFDKIAELQSLAQGKIRQFGVLIDGLFKVTDLALLQAIAGNLETEHKPCSIVYGADFTGEDIDNIADLRTRTENKVSVCIASDDNFIPAVGNVLGLISKAAVHENIGWIEKFNAASTGTYDAIYFGTGEAFADLTESQLNALNNKGYLFLRHHTGIAGSYWNDSHTCSAITGDYAYIENNRTIDKAIRGMRAYLLPKLNSPLTINPEDGTLAYETVKMFENLAGLPLEQMMKDGELSGYKVTVPTDQDVLATSELNVTVQLVIKGVARTITVTVGFAASV